MALVVVGEETQKIALSITSSICWIEVDWETRLEGICKPSNEEQMRGRVRSKRVRSNTQRGEEDVYTTLRKEC